jgi:hypothetical protein
MHRRAASTAQRLWDGFDRLNLLVRWLIYLPLFPLVEVLHAHRIRRFLRRRGAQRLKHTADDEDEVMRFWEMVNAKDTDRFGADATVSSLLKAWFIGEGELRRGNVEELVAWILFARPAAELEAARQRVVERVMRQLEASAGRAVPEGYEPRLTCLTHTLHPLAPCWKPLLVYLFLDLVRAAAGAVLRRRGFVLRSEGTALQYWHRPPFEPSPPSAAAPLPVVLLHGVGGLAFYTPLLLKLARARPAAHLFAPVLPHCSMLVPPYEPPPPVHAPDLTDAVARMVRRHAAGGAAPPSAAFFGHSLGTGFVASLTKTHPEVVATAVLVRRRALGN